VDLNFIRDQKLILLECISGSKSYNLNVPSSDTDYKGVFYMPKDKYYGFDYVPQISNETNDIVFYEIGRFVDLLRKNNPNILELLEIPRDKIIHKHPIMYKFRSKDFLSKKCKDTFGGYAFTQVRKARGLKKKIVNPIAKEKKSILHFCYVLHAQGSKSLISWLKETGRHQENIGLIDISNCKDTYGLYYDSTGEYNYKGVLKKQVATTVLLSSIPKGEKPLTHLFFNQDGFIKYSKDYKEYWDWVEKRNESRYENNIRHGKNYDSKNMMHTFRLLDMAKEILADGKLNVFRNNRDELLKIRNGEWEYDDLLKLADKKMAELEIAYSNSTLQEEPNVEFAEKLLIDIRKELYSD